jgi:uncharacterized protein
MTTQERDSLASLFDRLKLVERDPRDEATDKFVAQAVAAQPSAPYFLAQLLPMRDQGVTPGRNCDLRPRVVLWRA